MFKIIYSLQTQNEIQKQSESSSKSTGKLPKVELKSRKISVFQDGTLIDCGGYQKIVIEIPMKSDKTIDSIMHKINEKHSK